MTTFDLATTVLSDISTRTESAFYAAALAQPVTMENLPCALAFISDNALAIARTVPRGDFAATLEALLWTLRELA